MRGILPRGGTVLGSSRANPLKMVALRGTGTVRMPVADAIARLKTVDPKLYAEAGGVHRLIPRHRAVYSANDLMKRER